ncbi:Protein Wnt [Operophtera brumata]|uniref:Protein Wnt n=1 Tax=Operophtera brumata TaxID=104452 RepID=A0A0L7LIR4_OPEBR|nr:Protein Wnt [Operophtera brumata]
MVYSRVAAFERGTTLEGRVDIILVVKKPHRPLSVSRAPRKSELVYLEPSPSYCEPQRAAAALGTHGRHCNHTSRGEDGCEQLCCGRGHSTRRVVARVQCRCSFQWCCRVRCDTCRIPDLLDSTYVDNKM